jgi:hypothetical protein
VSQTSGGRVDVLRGGLNATVASLARVIADPAPVSDPQQAEELAHILSVVRRGAAAGPRCGPGGPCARAAAGHRMAAPHRRATRAARRR